MSPVLAQMRAEKSPVLAQMRAEKSPVPVLMWAGKTPVSAKMSGRGEPAVGWVESLAQLRMYKITPPTQMWAAGRTAGGLRRLGREGACVCLRVCMYVCARVRALSSNGPRLRWSNRSKYDVSKSGVCVCVCVCVKRAVNFDARNGSTPVT